MRGYRTTDRARRRKLSNDGQHSDVVGLVVITLARSVAQSVVTVVGLVEKEDPFVQVFDIEDLSRARGPSSRGPSTPSTPPLLAGGGGGH